MKACGFHFDTTYTALPNLFFTKLKPDSVAKPNMVILNDALAASMGLDFSNLIEKEQAQLFSGNLMPEGATPFAQAYAGHQFGHFNLLGDGRAHILGEHLTPEGDRFDIQLKGSGRTPYSRRGDGKATFSSMLREYIISEAMYHLGIPTTRSLAVATTGETVMRETALSGAILTRVASSLIRVGTFEFAAHSGDKKTIEALMNYTIQRHYPEQIESHNKALALIKALMARQADLIVHWMRIGFIHGVMNTDNMTLSGETIDYGPCAFIDEYDPNTVFSSIDHGGRYAYANQPQIAQWNLSRLVIALLPLIDDDVNKAVNLAEELVNEFAELYHQKWLSMMRCKLGLFGVEAGDELLISDLLNWMHKNRRDYTNTFLDLAQTARPTGKPYEQKSFEEWYLCWRERLTKNSKSFEASLSLMQESNPAVVPRNHKVEQALAAASNGDDTVFRNLLKVLEKPYQDRELLKPYQVPPEPNECVHQTFCGT